MLLPRCWTEDSEPCLFSGLPAETQSYCTQAEGRARRIVVPTLANETFELLV